MKHLALVSLMLLASCWSDESGARNALLEAGYTNVEIEGYKNACHSGDDTCTEFVATPPGGKGRTHGVVGCTRGIGCKAKTCTIRILGN